jgi:large subunit ribosomal protein L21
MFAVVETGGKQYHVTVGKVIKVEKLEAQVGSNVELSSVLAVNNKVGAPFVPSANVVAEVLEQAKTDKVIVFKKKRRHNYRRKQGHRQQVTVLRVKEINS